MIDLEGVEVMVVQSSGRKLPSELERYSGKIGTVLMTLKEQGHVVEFPSGSKQLFPFYNIAQYGNVLVAKESAEITLSNAREKTETLNFVPHYLDSKEKIKSYLENNPQAKTLKIVKTYSLVAGWSRNGVLCDPNSK